MPIILLKSLMIILLGGLSANAAATEVPRIPLVLVEGGEFDRGGPVACRPTTAENPCDSLVIADEQPRHRVKIKSFYLCKTEVTRGQWARVMQETMPPKKELKLPKTDISWLDTERFLKVLSRLDGHAYRLPTEAEWEYASGTGHLDVLERSAWFRKNSGGELQSVAQLKPNAFGLFDMLGNVWEWTSDWYDEEYYKHSPPFNPLGPSQGERRVVRGGAYNSVASYVRVGTRMGFAPDTKSRFTGFRCARSIKK